MKDVKLDILHLRQALEAAWRSDTAYKYVEEKGNPSLGQCYVTARVIQYYFPEFEIVEGEVETQNGTEKHFWNLFNNDKQDLHLDLTWQQFPPGSTVKSWKIRNRDTLNDGDETLKRFDKLLARVKQNMSEY